MKRARVGRSSVCDFSAKVAIPQGKEALLGDRYPRTVSNRSPLEGMMSDRLNEKQLTRLTVMALSLMLIIIGVVFVGLHYFSHW
jgi:hypothetical protein